MKRIDDPRGQVIHRICGPRCDAAPGGEKAKQSLIGFLLRSGEEGQATVEFAVALPMLLMLITGIMAFGQFLYVKSTLQTAASQGVQAVAIAQGMVADPCGYATTVVQQATALNSGSMTITFLNGGPTGTTMSGASCAGLLGGTTVSAKIQYPCPFLGIFKFVFSGSCPVTAIETEPVPSSSNN